MSLLSQELLISSLRTIIPERSSILKISQYIIINRKESQNIKEIFVDIYNNSNICHKLNLLYVANEILNYPTNNFTQNLKELIDLQNFLKIFIKQRIDNEVNNKDMPGITLKIKELKDLWDKKGTLEIQNDKARDANKKFSMDSSKDKGFDKDSFKGVDKDSFKGVDKEPDFKGGDKDSFKEYKEPDFKGGDKDSFKEYKEPDFKDVNFTDNIWNDEKGWKANDDEYEWDINNDKDYDKDYSKDKKKREIVRELKSKTKIRNKSSTKNNSKRKSESSESIFARKDIIERINKYFDSKDELIGVLERFIKHLKKC
ncbi:hypothetical protein DMUE_1780 [Dictyocoela muelleri]|nr:hypothetical protein DMUE_1780 [Dictyocoela muelleri]